MKLLLFFACVLAIMAGVFACSPAGSQTPTVTVTWTNPTTYTDGSPFVPATNMKGALISWGTIKGGAKPNQQIVAGALTSAVVSYPGTSGNYYFDVVIEDNNGTQSAHSVEVTKAVPFAPNPPTGIQVN